MPSLSTCLSKLHWVSSLILLNIFIFSPTKLKGKLYYALIHLSSKVHPVRMKNWRNNFSETQNKYRCFAEDKIFLWLHPSVINHLRLIWDTYVAVLLTVRALLFQQRIPHICRDQVQSLMLKNGIVYSNNLFRFRRLWNCLSNPDVFVCCNALNVLSRETAPPTAASEGEKPQPSK